VGGGECSKTPVLRYQRNIRTVVIRERETKHEGDPNCPNVTVGRKGNPNKRAFIRSGVKAGRAEEEPECLIDPIIISSKKGGNRGVVQNQQQRR